MQDSDTPVKIPAPFGFSAAGPYITTIPIPSQIGVTDGAASYTDGFPPLTFVSIDAGGAGPFGQDMNGLLNQISAGVRWFQAGAPLFHDVTFSTQIGGYPLGTILAADGVPGKFWRSIVQNNVTDPDTGGAGWVSVTQRVRLYGTTTYYVDFATGNDTTGNGSASLPWKTHNGAWNYLFANVDIGGQNVAIEIANSTGYPSFLAQGSLVGQTGTGSVVFSGNDVTPGSVGIFATNGTAVLALAGAAFFITGHTLTATGAGFGQGVGIGVRTGATVAYSSMIFGACTVAHVNANTGGTAIESGSNTCSGSATSHWIADGGSIIASDATMTLTGSPAFSTAFANAARVGAIVAYNWSFSGGATGPRYLVSLNGIIDNGAGVATPNYFPGDSAGSVVNGGQYSQ